MAHNIGNIKKVAVTTDDTTKLPYLFLFDQTRSLESIITDLCNHWRISSPTDHGLQLNEPLNNFYVSERNRSNIKDGTIMKLTLSTKKLVTDMLAELQRARYQEHREVLTRLSDASTDVTFAEEFIKQNGVSVLIDALMTDAVQHDGELLSSMLKSFVELMEHGLLSWEQIDENFIRKIAGCVSKHKTVESSVIQLSLEILEAIVAHCTSKYAIVEQTVSIATLNELLKSNTRVSSTTVLHVASVHGVTQRNAIALINTIFMKADVAKQKEIEEYYFHKGMRRNITESVLRNEVIESEMAHELYVLQHLLFNMLDEVRNTPVNVKDQRLLSEIGELKQMVFGTDIDATRRQSFAKESKKLGFQNVMNPIDDFLVVPPGVLALSNIIYFARNHPDEYTKVVLENSSLQDNHDLPFIQTSIELTNLLCDILHVGVAPTEDGKDYHSLFYRQNHPFEEFFSVSVQLLSKTWKEMRATTADYNKVFGVVREQITRALETDPDTFDDFKGRLLRLPYSEILQIWQQESRVKEVLDSQAKPMLELKEQLTPDIMSLIRQQRLNFLVEGTRFNMKVNRRTDKYVYCRLSPNHKFFHYGDCSETSVPSVEQLPKKLAVTDIKELLTGASCPHVKEKKKGQTTMNLAFSLVPTENVGSEPINFCAPDTDSYQMWLDGINALLGQQMTSELMSKDLEVLLDMEIKLRLLDTEGINIPETQPPIPPPPTNYDFINSLCDVQN